MKWLDVFRGRKSAPPAPVIKPRVKCILLGEGKYSFWVVRKGGSTAFLSDVYKYKSFDRAFWSRM